MIKGNVIGDGTYGIVYSCEHSDTGEKYAIKRNLTEKTILFLNCIRELDLLTKLRKHPHIVTLEYVSYGNPFSDLDFDPLVCKECEEGKEKEKKNQGDDSKHSICKERKNQRDDGIHFIYELASCNLHEYLGKHKNNQDFKLIKRYMIQILLAIEYIHKHSIIHCDLKPSNLLVLEDKTDILGNKNIIQICDFGLSIPHTYQGVQTPNVVTSWYRAPEIILGFPHYDYKSDIWSLGCIFFEMIANTQFLVNTPETNNSLISKILGSLPEEIPMKVMRSLVTSNKWRDIKLYSYHKPKGKRKSWINQLNLSKEASQVFEKEAGSLELFCDLLDQMLRFDWDERNDITECINHPFFEDQKILIDETRKECNPKCSLEKILYVVPCQERNWVKELVLNIYKDKAKFKWYNTRALFQSLHLFDSYMSGIYEDKGYDVPVFSKYETLLRYYSFLYLCVKYFSILDHSITFNNVFGAEYRTPEAKLEIENFEIGIVQKMEHDIYRTSIYEAADNFNIFMTDNQITKLLTSYFDINKPFNTTPTNFVKSVFDLK